MSEITGTRIWSPGTVPWGWNLSSNYLVEGGAWDILYILISPVNYYFSKLLPSTSANCSIYLHGRKEACLPCMLQLLIPNIKHSALTHSKYLSIQDMNEWALDVTSIFLYINQIQRIKIANTIIVTGLCSSCPINSLKSLTDNGPGLNSHGRLRNKCHYRFCCFLRRTEVFSWKQIPTINRYNFCCPLQCQPSSEIYLSPHWKWVIPRKSTQIF